MPELMPEQIPELTPEIVDYILIAVLAVFVPVHGYIETANLKEQFASQKPGILRKIYFQTMAQLWVLAIAVVGVWFFYGRPLADLGFSDNGPSSLLWTWVGVGILCVFLVFQAFMAGSNDKVAQSIMRQLDGKDGVLNMIPKTDGDRQLFNFVSLTAGITEEIIYRGYLIWAFSFFMPVWLAAMAALVVFMLGHLYQRSLGAVVMVGVNGGALTLAYLISGSLLPAMVLHIVMDLAGGATIWRARQKVAA